MLRLPTAVCFRGASSLLNASATSRVSTHLFTTLGSASYKKLIRTGRPLITLARDKKLSAAFSTHSSGLRKVLWVDLTWVEMGEFDSQAAQLSFEKSNPFDDPKAHNCVIVFQYPLKGFPYNIVQIASAYGFGEDEANIVQKELNKVVEEQAKLLEDPKAFFARLKEAGLRCGELMASGGPEETNEWWERLLYCMPENDKYW